MSEHDHYFTAAPASADERRWLRVRLAGREVDAEVAPGIFSPGGLDKGTAVLLDEAPAPPATGTFLDL
ncbi:MAG TPA: 16S rRNA methyltransferase, partial [Humibacillus xanthopallidus]|nr:16S rRNA methyltransferase [Humibacillus xanthopallidus]